MNWKGENLVEGSWEVDPDKPDSHGAEDYLALCKEIIERE